MSLKKQLLITLFIFAAASAMIVGLSGVVAVGSENAGIGKPLLVMGLAAFTCAVLALILGRIFAKRVTLPIDTLTDAFTQASQSGEYVPCPAAGSGELNMLTEAYNAMTARINSYNSVLEDIAFHDPVTGLGNWAAIENKLDSFFMSGEAGGVVIVDLDDFKDINEIYGRDFGDEVLRGIGARLYSEDLGFDLCARTGGDEFCLIKRGTRDELTRSVQALPAVIGEPLNVNGVVIELTPSAGVAMFPENGNTFKSVCKHAEIAMYKAKAEGKNCFHFFDEKMVENIERNNDIALALKNSLEINSMFLVYQPEVDPKTGKVRAFEALMRVNDPVLGFLNPGEFVPMAESSGIIIKLGNGALEAACRFAMSFYAKCEDFDNISVNVSAIQLFERSFVPDVIGILEKTGLPPRLLQLEITESTLIRNMKSVTKKLAELRGLGVTVALDDFGAEYSSLKYLTDLPISTLKIDKSFIDGMLTDKKRETVTKTIVKMAHEMNLKVVAEGIESKSQCDMLRDEGCDLIQGYYYGRPLPEAEALAIMNGGGTLPGNNSFTQ